MRILTLLLTLTLLTQSALADCPSYQMVEAGDSVPCSGIFLNQSTNDAVSKDLRDYELTKGQLKLQDLQIKVLEEDRDKWAKEAIKQAETRHEQSNDLRNGVLYGIGITLAVLFGVKQVSK